MAPACQELAPGAELETLTVNGSSREKSKSSRLVFSTGGDGVQPPRGYFNLDWSLKRVSRFGQKQTLGIDARHREPMRPSYPQMCVTGTKRTL